MKHYLQYHKIHEFGRPVSVAGDFAAFTDKAVTDAWLGAVIWLVSGEKQIGKIEYHLEYAFVVERIEALNGGRFCLRGSQGKLPPKPIRLATDPWFLEMKRRSRNFNNGLSQVPEEWHADMQALLRWVPVEPVDAVAAAAEPAPLAE